MYCMMVRDLGYAVDREKAAMGFFVTLAVTMKEEAVSAGFYDAPRFGFEYPKLQILTMIYGYPAPNALISRFDAEDTHV